jgi:hypothetical protein
MTKNDQKVDRVKESGRSIGFLRASEKMQISTFEIPLVFLEDMGFSKERIGAAKDFNRKFVSGFYEKVRKAGEKLSFGGRPSEKIAEQKLETKAKPAKVAATAKAKPKRPEEKDVPSNVSH